MSNFMLQTPDKNFSFEDSDSFLDELESLTKPKMTEDQFKEKLDEDV